MPFVPRHICSIKQYQFVQATSERIGGSGEVQPRPLGQRVSHPPSEHEPAHSVQSKRVGVLVILAGRIRHGANGRYDVVLQLRRTIAMPRD